MFTDGTPPEFKIQNFHGALFDAKKHSDYFIGSEPKMRYTGGRNSFLSQLRDLKKFPKEVCTIWWPFLFDSKALGFFAFGSQNRFIDCKNRVIGEKRQLLIRGNILPSICKTSRSTGCLNLCNIIFQAIDSVRKTKLSWSNGYLHQWFDMNL